jgi:hypothetical protein
MDVEITPEPSENEREAILAALAQEAHTVAQPWAEEEEEP